MSIFSTPVNDYVIKLKKLSNTCEFGPFLVEALRDKFIAGLNNELRGYGCPKNTINKAKRDVS